MAETRRSGAIFFHLIVERGDRSGTATSDVSATTAEDTHVPDAAMPAAGTNMDTVGASDVVLRILGFPLV